MRAPLLLPISIALLAAFPALAQDAPRVLFCSGPCFAVDANGVRTPAPKGTELRLDQRFETGPGAYAQVKLGPDAAMALGDGARVRFDQKNFRDRLIVSLDVGRVRMIGGEAIGKPVTRPVELHTPDGVFVLRNADIEARKVPAGTAVAAMTSVRVNAGEASLRTSQGDALVGKNVVQGVAAGRVVGDVAVPSPSVALPPTRAHAALPSPVSGPIALVTPPDLTPAGLRPNLLPPRLLPAAQPPRLTPLPGGLPSLTPTPPISGSPKPVLPRGEFVPRLPIVTPTGEIKTLTSYVLTDPVLTTSATTSSLQLIDTSTTLSTSSLTSINLTTTTSTSLTDSTVTKISTSPTLVTTTTTTTSTLTTSPLITTTTQPITISPILIR